MALQPFDPDVLRHKVVRIIGGERIQIDPVASILLSARLVSVDGQITVEVYTDRDANYSSDDETTEESEESLAAFTVNSGLSDTQPPKTPHTPFNYGMFAKAEGLNTSTALLVITYVHRVDYPRSFEPIQVSTWVNSQPPLGELYGLPDVPPWEPGVDAPGAGGELQLAEPGPLADQAMSYDNEIKLDVTSWRLLEGGSFIVGVSLSSAPLGTVELSITNETSETSTSLSALTFTPANFDTVQNVTVNALSDALVEGELSYHVTFAVSTGDNLIYSPSLTPDKKLTVSIVDPDTVEYGMFFSKRSLVLQENATAESVEITLRSQPTADVTLTLDAAAFGGLVEVSDGGAYAESVDFIFTNANWDTPQLAYLQAPDNSVEAASNPLTDTVALYVASTVDVNYAALDWFRVYLTLMLYDDDTTSFGAGIIYIETEDQDAEYMTPLLITEGGDAFLRLE